jgi:hypothetical protein
MEIMLAYVLVPNLSLFTSTMGNFSSLIASKEQTVKRESEKERGQPDPFLSYHITRVRLHMCRSEIEN